MDKETIVTNDHTPRLIRPEDKSYRDVMMVFSDQPVKPKYWFEDFGDYWSCSCGQINRNAICSNCGLERELLRRIFSNAGADKGESSKSDPAYGSTSSDNKTEYTSVADGSTPDSGAQRSTGSSDTGDPATSSGARASVASSAAQGPADSSGARASVASSAAQRPADSVAFAPPDEESEEEAALRDYMRKKHRTRVMMVILVFLIVLLGVGLAVFYFYGLPELDRQENMETEAVTDVLAQELPTTLPNVGDKEFDINRNIADYYYDKKEYEKAVDHYLKALKIKDDESVRHKMNAAKYSYVSANREKGGSLFEDYLEDLYKAKYTGINDIYYDYYTWKASIVTNTGVSDYSTDMTSINRSSIIYFHTTFSGGPPDESLDLYYEIVWPDGTTEKKAVSATKSSGETLTTTCQYTFPSASTEGKLVYKLYNNANNKQIATDSVTLL